MTDQEQIDVTWDGDASDYTTLLYDGETGESKLLANPGVNPAQLYQRIN